MGEQKYRELVEGEPVNKSTDEVLLNLPYRWEKMNDQSLNMCMWRNGEPWKPIYRKVRRPIK